MTCHYFLLLVSLALALALALALLSHSLLSPSSLPRAPTHTHTLAGDAKTLKLVFVSCEAA